jgi:hypothetical protein
MTIVIFVWIFNRVIAIARRRQLSELSRLSTSQAETASVFVLFVNFPYCDKPIPIANRTELAQKPKIKIRAISKYRAKVDHERTGLRL